jgi:hypothetical protein
LNVTRSQVKSFAWSKKSDTVNSKVSISSDKNKSHDIANRKLSVSPDKDIPHNRKTSNSDKDNRLLNAGFQNELKNLKQSTQRKPQSIEISSPSEEKNDQSGDDINSTTKANIIATNSNAFKNPPPIVPAKLPMMQNKSPKTPLMDVSKFSDEATPNNTAEYGVTPTVLNGLRQKPTEIRPAEHPSAPETIEPKIEQEGITQNPTAKVPDMKLWKSESSCSITSSNIDKSETRGNKKPKVKVPLPDMKGWRTETSLSSGGASIQSPPTENKESNPSVVSTPAASRSTKVKVPLPDMKGWKPEFNRSLEQFCLKTDTNDTDHGNEPENISSIETKPESGNISRKTTKLKAQVLKSEKKNSVEKEIKMREGDIKTNHEKERSVIYDQTFQNEIKESFLNNLSSLNTSDWNLFDTVDPKPKEPSENLKIQINKPYSKSNANLGSPMSAVLSRISIPATLTSGKPLYSARRGTASDKRETLEFSKLGPMSASLLELKPSDGIMANEKDAVPKLTIPDLSSSTDISKKSGTASATVQSVTNSKPCSSVSLRPPGESSRTSQVSKQPEQTNGHSDDEVGTVRKIGSYELRSVEAPTNYLRALFIPLNGLFNMFATDLSNSCRFGRNNSTDHGNFVAFPSLVVSRNHTDIFIRDKEVLNAN